MFCQCRCVARRVAVLENQTGGAERGGRAQYRTNILWIGHLVEHHHGRGLVTRVAHAQIVDMGSGQGFRLQQ